MLETIFKDMEYVRVMDWILDNIKGQLGSLDIQDISRNTFIPYTKVQDILEDFADIHILQHNNNDDFEINEDSEVMKMLLAADFACAKIYADELKE